jgi:hypothetical protein
MLVQTADLCDLAGPGDVILLRRPFERRRQFPLIERVWVGVCTTFGP